MESERLLGIDHIRKAYLENQRVKAYDAQQKETLHKKVMKRAAAAKLASMRDGKVRSLLSKEKRDQILKSNSRKSSCDSLLGIVQPKGCISSTNLPVLPSGLK